MCLRLNSNSFCNIQIHYARIYRSQVVYATILLVMPLFPLDLRLIFVALIILDRWVSRTKPVDKLGDHTNEYEMLTHRLCLRWLEWFPCGL